MVDLRGNWRRRQVELLVRNLGRDADQGYELQIKKQCGGVDRVVGRGEEGTARANRLQREEMG